MLPAIQSKCSKTGPKKKKSSVSSGMVQAKCANTHKNQYTKAANTQEPSNQVWKREREVELYIKREWRKVQRGAEHLYVQCSKHLVYFLFICSFVCEKRNWCESERAHYCTLWETGSFCSFCQAQDWPECCGAVVVSPQVAQSQRAEGHLFG